MQPRFITVQGHSGRKVRAKVGDNVTILKKVTTKRGKADVAKFPAPHIVEIDKENGRVVARVQFHTEAKRALVQSFHGPELQLAEPMFKIGDNVEVVEKQRGVLVPVGTQGTVVGGDGTTFYVNFLVDHGDAGSVFEPTLNVSQDGIQGSALKYVKRGDMRVKPRDSDDDSSSSSNEEKDDEEEEEDDEEEGSKGSSSSNSSSSREDDNDDDEQAEAEAEAEVEGYGDGETHTHTHTQEKEDAEVARRVDARMTPADFVHKHMSSSAHRALLRHLNATTLRNFERWFHNLHAQKAHVVVVDSLPQLQQVLIHFTRSLQPAFRLTPAHKIALREIGATSSDLLEIEQQPQLAGGSVEDVMRFYSSLKKR
jgi:flagellar biosynthesis GTPase FlhF